MNQRILIIVSTLILAAAFCPCMQGFSDVLLPRWYLTGGVFLMIGIVSAWNDSLCFAIGKATSFPIASALILSAECIYALTRHYSYGYPLSGTFDNQTGMALNLCLLLPALSWNFKARRMWVKWTLIAVALLTAVTVVMSECRTGMICIGIYLAILIWHSLKCRRIWRMALILLLAGIASWGVFGMKHDSTSGRSFIIARTMELISERPLFGYGHNGFEREYMQHQADFFMHHPDSEYAWLADDISHPLSEFLLVWTDYGILATILLLTLFILPFSLYFSNRDKQLGRLLPSMITIIVFSVFSYPFMYPLTALTCLVVVYVCARQMGLNKWIRKQWPLMGTRKGRIVKTAACSALLLLLCWQYSYEYRFSQAIDRMNSHRSHAALPRFNALYSHYHGNQYFLYAYMGCQYRTSHLYEALNTAWQLKQYCSSYDIELLTGDIFRHLSDHLQALSHYERAYWMCPVRFAPLEGMLLTYEDMGNCVKRDSIAHVISQKPVKVPSADVERIRQLARECLDGR